MSTAISSPAMSEVARDRFARRGEPAAIPFARLVGVEWRKQLDTRAGRWLLIVIAIVTAIVLTIMSLVDGGQRTFGELIGGTETPLSMLLPVVGILAATSEWSQRTGLVTFVLEPRRTRVAAAKLLAALASGLVFFVIAFALAALTYLGLVLFRDVPADWSLDAGQVVGGFAVVLLRMVEGVAFGFLFLNTPLAIVFYFVSPVLFTFVGALPGMEGAVTWIDLSVASSPVLAGDAHGADWAHLAVATAIWVVVPLVVGLFRVNRTEIKSS